MGIKAYKIMCVWEKILRLFLICLTLLLISCNTSTSSSSNSDDSKSQKKENGVQNPQGQDTTNQNESEHSEQNNQSNNSDNESQENEYYTVSFITDGGSYIADQYVKFGEKASKPENPTKKELYSNVWLDYIFAGWFTDIEYINAFSFETPIKQNLVLYAKWESDICRISFETNGGSEIEDVYFHQGSVIACPTDPYKYGYEFMGWYTSSNYDVLFDFSSQIEEDLTIYARWKKKEVIGGKIIINEISDITVSKQEFSDHIVFTADSEYESYLWYIDSEIIQTGDNTLSLSLSTLKKGIHELFLVVKKNDRAFSYRTTLNIQ